MIPALLGSLLLVVGLYVTGLVALWACGRRCDAYAWARFIPDSMILVRRLIADQRVPRSRKALLAVLIAYLALPIDLVPDFIPIAGQLDDVIVLALVLGAILRAGGEQLLDEHWPGPERSLGVFRGLVFGLSAP